MSRAWVGQFYIVLALRKRREERRGGGVCGPCREVFALFKGTFSRDAWVENYQLNTER
jgi:hypothetical protein